MSATDKVYILADSSLKAQILADTNELQVDNIPGTLATIAGYLDTEITAIKDVTDALPDAGALTTIAADAARLTAERAAVLTDWIDGERLDLLLDAIPTAAQVNAEMVDVMATDTHAEVGQGTPPATASYKQMMQYLFKNWRNKKTQDATTLELYNDAGDTVDQKSTLSDDGTDFTKGEMTTGA